MELGPLILKHAAEHHLDPHVVACIILQESGGNPLACRAEKAFLEQRLLNKRLSELAGWTPKDPGNYGSPSIYTEKTQRATSWGLMQVLGDTARWLCKVEAPFLTALAANNDLAIRCGCQVLSFYLKRYKTYPKALSAYNTGNPESTVGAEYAARVMARVMNKEYERYVL